MYNNPEKESEDYVKVSLINQGIRPRRRKKCALIEVKLEDMNYKNLILLNKYIFYKNINYKKYLYKK
jgi:ribosomal protein S18